jgi:hypothetical protein
MIRIRPAPEHCHFYMQRKLFCVELTFGHLLGGGLLLLHADLGAGSEGEGQELTGPPLLLLTLHLRSASY